MQIVCKLFADRSCDLKRGQRASWLLPGGWTRHRRAGSHSWALCWDCSYFGWFILMLLLVVADIDHHVDRGA